MALAFRNKVRNKEMDLGNMNLYYIMLIVEKYTVSGVVYRKERERESEREGVAQNLGTSMRSKNRITNRNKENRY